MSADIRTRDQIRQFFNDLQLIEPGLADLSAWYLPSDDRPAGPLALRILAGIGAKP